MHIQNIFNGYSGSKKWSLMYQFIKNRNLNNLLKILDCDRMNNMNIFINKLINFIGTF